MYSKVFLFAVVGVAITYAFKIPLPFGQINVDKEEDGTVNAGVNSNINILGYGGSSGLEVTSKNGSLALKPQAAILANNTAYGANSTYSVDKKEGIVADTDVDAGNHTFHGGVGKESQFVNEVGDAVKSKKNKRGRA
ncbi:unnamed protein product [Bursaphelenchus xylophilus]|uniref:(pine wood nematode) hypothetical protein n=1 Tax=Bursaphelenchus xylophilus TaxID=6326 RepID=A0A1I7SMH0_BURXY|nr:unnamed protein product [Bursaphelenchus xylophilus]CAG9130198.1 unnamed protein product [Bursaphelenchus xylophilus]